jgi:ribonucleoside-diphosphate reductase alpha chain
MAEAAWICGDPGIQYDTTINDWNPVANTARQYATNPCSEFSFINDTSCNLASLNLMKFVDADGEFDAEAFGYASRLTITAQEIIVDNASYPTARIEENSHRFRPLGLGYANLGALLMSRGLAYDSDAGRAYAAVITAIMTGEAYRQSAVIARDHGGPFVDYAVNEGPFLRVIGKHREAAHRIATTHLPEPLVQAARQVWDEALELGEQHGYRNAQTSLLAPTGTIAFMMDCDTTGIEPDIALIKYKKLVGEGFLKIVNGTVPGALRRLGYSPAEVEAIVAWIDERETIEGAPGLKPEHLAVFDCAFKPVNGERSIHHMGHLRMMSATQPFLSGAISKTVNMPEHATAEDIEDVYLQGWKLGLKAIAIYRDGSKRSQPLSTGKKTAAAAEAVAPTADSPGLEPTSEPKPYRRRLPDERRAVTHKFQVAGHEGYITVGLYPDGQPGEIFLKMAKEGSTVSGLMDTLATMTSIALQYGVPLRDLVSKFAHVRFEPSGFTGNPEVPIAKSIVDYIFRWMGSRFLSKDDRDALGILGGAVVAEIPSAVASGPGSIDLATGFADSTAAEPPPAPSTSSGGEGGDRPMPSASAAWGTTAAAGGHASNGNGSRGGNGTAIPSLAAGPRLAFSVSADSPSCMDCGSIMVRSGSCYKCLNCGATSGCS